MSNQLKTNKQSTSAALLAAEAIQEIRQRIVGIYMFLMFAVFPLFIVDKYYNILKEKFYFFFYATLITAGITALLGLVGLFGRAGRNTVREKKPFLKKVGDGIKNLWHGLSLTDKFFFAFLVAVSISTAFSEWPYQAFWGNMGRYQGLLFYLTAGVAYILVTRFYRYKKIHLYAFVIAGVLVSLWGITDYFALDLFGFHQTMGNKIDLLPFSSSIGNINTLTGLLALYMGAAAVLCIDSDKWYLTFPAMFIFVAGMVGGTSDNAVLGVACVYALTPFFAFRTGKGIYRYLFMAAMLFLGMGVMGLLTVLDTVTDSLATYPWMVGVLVGISRDHYRLLLIGAAVLLAAGFLVKKLYCGNEENGTGPAVKIWAVITALAVLFAAGIFIMANTGHLPEALAPYEGILVFDENWGTFRGYAWTKLFEFFGKFPFHKKLFGSGPETYSIFMAKNYYYEMQEVVGQIFDSPHSEPLQYLFTMGILGFVTYYGSVTAACVRGMKQGGTARIFAFAAIAYTAASLVNISVPITTPLVFLSLAIAGSIKEDSEENS